MISEANARKTAVMEREHVFVFAPPSLLAFLSSLFFQCLSMRADLEQLGAWYAMVRAPLQVNMVLKTYQFFSDLSILSRCLKCRLALSLELSFLRVSIHAKQGAVLLLEHSNFHGKVASSTQDKGSVLSSSTFKSASVV